MNITATENALDFLEWHPEFNLPSTAFECFSGMTTLDGLNTPDLYVGIACMNETLTRFKNELKMKIESISPECSTLVPSTMSQHYIIDNIDITLITEKDSKSGTQIPVRNLFKYQITQNNEDSYEVIESPKNIEEDPNDNLLGAYLPQTGSIMLWIDRIIRKDRSDLIFQKVLLHEMIHAFLDIYPRVYFKYPNGMCSILSAIGKQNTTESEETIDNFLVLDCYSHCRKEYYDFVKKFISNQPKEYRAAIDKYNPKNSDRTIIKAHLEDKVSICQNFDISHNINFYFIVPVDDDKSNEDKYVINFFEADICEGLKNIPFSFKEFEKNSNGILCKRVLLSKGWADFRSPWITYRLNLSAKIISLRIGNILYYQLNDLNGKEECIDLVNHKKVRDNQGLDFEISEDASRLITNFIYCLNPATIFSYDNFIPDSQWHRE